MDSGYLFYMVVHGFCVGILVMIGLYLIFSVRSAFQENVQPNRLVRKTAGWNAFLWAGTFAFTLLYPFVESTRFADILPRLDYMACLLVVPGVAVLMLSLLQMQNAMRKYFWLHLLAPVALIVWYLFDPSRLPVYLTFAYWLLYSLCFFYWFYRQEHRYRRHLKDLYSDLEHHEIRWIYGIVALFILYLVLFILVHVVWPNYKLHYISYVYCLGLWVLLTHHVDYHECAVRFWVGSAEAPEEEIMDEATPVAETASAGSDGKAADAMAQDEHEAPAATDRNLYWVGEKLAEECEAAGLYLRQDLGIDVLAAHLGTNRTYISRYLASKGMTYYGYINGLRVSYAKRMMDAEPDASLSAIAYQSGFKSDNTFRRAFLEVENCLPSEYMKRKEA